MTVFTLSGLSKLCETYRFRDVIVVDADEWASIRNLIPSESVVAATADRPPFFWFRDKKIVTPAWVIAENATARTGGPDAQFSCPLGGTHFHRESDRIADCPTWKSRAR